MIRLAAMFLLAFALHADTKAAKPPSPKVDKALRERIAEFYQRQVDGRYRDAEEFVAADTKDYFYSSNKMAYLSCALDRVEYSNDAKLAKAWVQCERNIMFPGFAGQVLKLPVISTWKLEKGKWFWYVDRKNAVDTPFGPIKTVTPGDKQPSGPPSTPFSIPTTMDFALNKVKADRTNLTLKPGASAELRFKNTAPGVMTLVYKKASEYIVVSPMRVQLVQDGTVTVNVKALEGAQAVTLVFAVEPTGEEIAIPVKIE